MASTPQLVRIAANAIRDVLGLVQIFSRVYLPAIRGFMYFVKVENLLDPRQYSLFSFKAVELLFRGLQRQLRSPGSSRSPSGRRCASGPLLVAPSGSLFPSLLLRPRVCRTALFLRVVLHNLGGLRQPHHIDAAVRDCSVRGSSCSERSRSARSIPCSESGRTYGRGSARTRASAPGRCVHQIHLQVGCVQQGLRAVIRTPGPGPSTRNPVAAIAAVIAFHRAAPPRHRQFVPARTGCTACPR